MAPSIRRKTTMKTISLTNSSRKALVDDRWHELLMDYEWHEQIGKNTSYAYREVENADGTKTRILMHREIMGLEPGDERQVDHTEGNGLMNLASKLRIATRSQNQANRGLFRNSTSGYKGVSPHRASGKWQAHAGFNGRVIYLGLFTSEVEAAVAYNEAAQALHHEFARLNPIPTELDPGPERVEHIRRQVTAKIAERTGGT